MGAWGAGNFENDTAADWAGALAEDGSPETVRDALRSAVEAADDYIDADEGAEALAAAEVVAAAAGRGTERTPYSEDALRWAAEHHEVGDQATLQLARAAVDAVAAPQSELYELWSEANDDGTPAPDWLAAIDDLKRRLG